MSHDVLRIKKCTRSDSQVCHECSNRIILTSSFIFYWTNHWRKHIWQSNKKTYYIIILYYSIRHMWYCFVDLLHGLNSKTLFFQDCIFEINNLLKYTKRQKVKTCWCFQILNLSFIVLVSIDRQIRKPDWQILNNSWFTLQYSAWSRGN